MSASQGMRARFQAVRDREARQLRRMAAVEPHVRYMSNLEEFVTGYDGADAEPLRRYVVVLQDSCKNEEFVTCDDPCDALDYAAGLVQSDFWPSVMIDADRGLWQAVETRVECHPGTEWLGG